MNVIRHTHIRKLIALVGLLAVSLVLLANPAKPTDAAVARIRVPVAMYHYISIPPVATDLLRYNLSVAPALFDQQMKWLHNHGYVTVTADQVANALSIGASLPLHAILLTFDDGYEDAYSNAFPTLKKYGLVGTFFVVTDWIDQNRPGYLTWDQVREMAHAGMSIEPHSRTHNVLDGTNIPWLRSEIEDSMADIQQKVGIHPTIFAYPYGRFDQNTLRIVKESGLVAAFTTAGGGASSTYNLFTEPRIRISGGTTAVGFGYELHAFGF